MRPPSDRDVSAIDEAGAADDGEFLCLNRFDDGQRRGLMGERGQEVVEIRCVAFDLDDRAGAVVAHRAGQGVRGGAGVDERPEADALHDTVHTDSQPAPARSWERLGHPRRCPSS